MKALWEWLNASEWRILGTILVGFGLFCALVVWLAIRDHERQCQEKGTYTVCVRERFSHMVKIGDTYHAQYVCLEHAEKECEP